MPPLYISPEDVLQPMSLQTTVDPVSQGVGTVVSPWFNAAEFQGVVALIQTGVLGAAATVDAKLRQATDISGTGAKDVAGKAIAQIVKASGDNKQAVITARDWQIDKGSGYVFVGVSITVGGAPSQISAAVFGVNSRSATHRPVPVAASLAQIVT